MQKKRTKSQLTHYAEYQRQKATKKRRFEKIGGRECFIVNRVAETEVNGGGIGTKVATKTEVVSNHSNCFYEHCQFNSIPSTQQSIQKDLYFFGSQRAFHWMIQ